MGTLLLPQMYSQLLWLEPLCLSNLPLGYPFIPDVTVWGCESLFVHVTVSLTKLKWVGWYASVVKLEEHGTMETQVWTTTTAAASSIGSAYCLGDSVAAVVVDDDVADVATTATSADNILVVVEDDVVGINDINFCQCE